MPASFGFVDCGTWSVGKRSGLVWRVIGRLSALGSENASADRRRRQADTGYIAIAGGFAAAAAAAAGDAAEYCGQR